MKRNTRELILSTAIKVIARDGLASVNAIIQESGLSKGVFFHHFRSRQDLLVELAELDFKGRIERIKERAKTLSDQPGRMLKAYVMVWVDDVCLTGSEQLNALSAFNEPAIRQCLSEQSRHLFDMLWDPSLPEATVRVILNACIGGWAQNLLADEDRETTVAARREMAGEMFRIIEAAAVPREPSAQPE